MFAQWLCIIRPRRLRIAGAAASTLPAALAAVLDVSPPEGAVAAVQLWDLVAKACAEEERTTLAQSKLSQARRVLRLVNAERARKTCGQVAQLLVNDSIAQMRRQVRHACTAAAGECARVCDERRRPQRVAFRIRVRKAGGNSRPKRVAQVPTGVCGCYSSMSYKFVQHVYTSYFSSAIRGLETKMIR